MMLRCTCFRRPYRASPLSRVQSKFSKCCHVRRSTSLSKTTRQPASFRLSSHRPPWSQTSMRPSDVTPRFENEKSFWWCITASRRAAHSHVESPCVISTRSPLGSTVSKRIGNASPQTQPTVWSRTMGSTRPATQSDATKCISSCVTTKMSVVTWLQIQLYHSGWVRCAVTTAIRSSPMRSTTRCAGIEHPQSSTTMRKLG